MTRPDQLPSSGLRTRTGRTGVAGLSRSSRILSAVVAALAICIVIAAAIVIAGLHRDARARVEQENRRLSTVLAEYTGSMMQAVDLALQEVDHDAGLSSLTSPEQFRAVMGTPEMNCSLAARQSGLQQVMSLSAIDVAGRFANVSRVWPPPAAELSDRAYFRAMQADTAPAMYVSEPVLSRTANQWGIFLLRRVSPSDGRFLGLLGGYIRLAYFNQFYASLGLPPGTRVTIRRHDGLLIDEFPGNEPRFPVLPPTTRWYRTMAAGGGEYWTNGSLDGVVRLASLRRVPGFPVAVVVSTTKAAIYAVWRKQAAVIGFATTWVVVVLVLLVRALIAQFRRLESTRAAKELQRKPPIARNQVSWQQ